MKARASKRVGWKHEGMRVEIQACDNCLDAGKRVEGTVLRVSRWTFSLRTEAGDMLLARDEWEILNERREGR